MTNLEVDIMAFILRAMLNARVAVSDSTLRGMIKTAFSHIDFTPIDLGKHIARVENAKLIASGQDDIFGLMWALTPSGKIKAQQLG